MAATLVDMGTQDRRADKDADFSAYMSARQPALYRTAYLLAGDHAGAEDLLQTAFAKLYLSWDKDPRPRRARRLRPPRHGQRAQLAVAPGVEAPRARHRQTARVRHPRRVRRRDGRCALVLRPDPPAEAARGGRAPLLRAAERGRDRRHCSGSRSARSSRRPAAPSRDCAPAHPAPSTPTSPETTHDEPHSPRGPGPRRPAPPGRPAPALPLHSGRRPHPRPSHPAPPRPRGRSRRRRRAGHRDPGRPHRDRAGPAQRRAPATQPPAPSITGRSSSTRAPPEVVDDLPCR